MLSSFDGAKPNPRADVAVLRSVQDDQDQDNEPDAEKIEK